MAAALWFLLVTGGWLLLLAAHRHLTRRFPRLDALLHHAGLSISLFHIRWHTRCLNGLFHALATHFRHHLRPWFSLGVLVSVLAMVFSVSYLSVSLFHGLIPRRPSPPRLTTPTDYYYTGNKSQVTVSVVTREAGGDSPAPALAPMLPGLTLPLEDWPYFFLALAAASVFHELGHAVAAIRERVHIDSFGFFVFFVFPAACVEVHTDHLCLISPLRRLRIFCAGVWHNLLLTVVALLMSLLLPALLLPLYERGAGVVVLDVHPASTLAGPGGLSPGYTITSVGGCQVSNASQWWACLVESQRAEATGGHCVSHVQLLAHHHLTLPRDGDGECCAPEQQARSMCFTYRKQNLRRQHSAVCLPARWVLAQTRCQRNSHCGGAGSCVQPVLANGSRLVEIGVREKQQPVLHLGDPRSIYWAVATSDSVPRLPGLPSRLPQGADKLARYLASLSAALAMLNVVPCYGLDGQYILTTCMDVVPVRWCSVGTRRLLTTTALLSGTVLIGSNIVIALKPYTIDLVFNPASRDDEI